MRPVRIEVEGFSAYRQKTAVDFDGVDFFSLAGPTGSGKSSLIDAMVFALYGRVPRLGGNSVAPAIAAGADRARVRFDFEVDGATYTAVRLAQRTTSGGASVAEARLQEGESVIANGAGDVTSAVEELLHLDFDDFTKTVVLPQGEFARFLTEGRAKRQELLRGLLGFDVYTRMRDLARTRAAVATERAEGARRRLESLDLPDEETKQASIERKDTLVSLADVIADRENGLHMLEAKVGEADAARQSLVDARTRLAAIQPPERLGELDSLRVEAQSALIDATAAHDALVAEAEKVNARLAEMPSREIVETWVGTYDRLADIRGRLADAGVEDARKGVSETEEAVESATQTLHRARADMARVRTEHAAHALAADLVEGEPCPVCTQTVATLPAPADLSDLAISENAERQAELDLEKKRDAADKARTELAAIESRIQELQALEASLLVETSQAPSPDELKTTAEEVDQLNVRSATLREEIDRQAKEVSLAEKKLEDLTDASRQMSRDLRVAERTVADLDPPLSESDEPVVLWKELVAWRDETVESMAGRLAEAARALETAQKTASDARQSLVETLEEHDIVATEPFAVAIASELQVARSVVEMHARTAGEATRLAGELTDARDRADVAGALASHLKANGFEQWLMAGALTDLVEGANDLLEQLSEGGYALFADDSGNFSIIDHRNANESRLVSTLSGGETFLVSLALALSLAETLAAKGGSGLDAIILDEGFGALDDTSLDTVAAVLEELTGRGLMVGVITHVKDLAGRAPVRYEVIRDPGGARVSLVS